MPNYDYFKQYVSEMERIKAKTAHDEHILEFQAMCAKMINDAIPEIKRQCLEECKNELKIGAKREEKADSHANKPEVQFHFSVKDLEKQIRNAFK